MNSLILTISEAESMRRAGKCKGFAIGYVARLKKNLQRSAERRALRKGEPILVMSEMKGNEYTVRIGNWVGTLDKSFFDRRNVIKVAYNFF